jgi:hypothetical protein
MTQLDLVDEVLGALADPTRRRAGGPVGSGPEVPVTAGPTARMRRGGRAHPLCR